MNLSATMTAIGENKRAKLWHVKRASFLSVRSSVAGLPAGLPEMMLFAAWKYRVPSAKCWSTWKR